ncbi:hypothetical protein COW36_15360 [bacterium (Candidatus Blackallbacteria) CG17_big_fil_post_rev_8_21_14_2_50_48_46]|uniref:Roadblock/LAMTOR2 domain-containing protein n=1 Tax=bacterium (Candidatus Blackallbacteria) CG17_big_fil_post_rev_8_21_14_2_50_48_46 TaxID=2014261 RepID=A0A2M7G2N5_9BACT|nr:MAG: hypothetical protein COW64_11190 [bacterium (Candidatus Blackallbacteria) CG18_big_fil_WC_8_21_14_2_50_49_26]PIW16087.1 MAG: hypothetical protein COW36_15360 [bacterium (Candidatus Blackallbacteria) CG17_big_fil_post_rev_8_21_14_2_50_48_46]PIW50499.1 MAG: hypothetical protein COW20_03075 [bacterium (Candidatus Blackallbacteria) CG13_big_fil_rev_8_21_14_2_50_49_14]
MNKTDQVCQKIVSEFESVLAFGVVDLFSGKILGLFHTIPYFQQDYIDAVVAASVDLFRGKSITRIEALLAEQRGTQPRHLIEEVFMTTQSTYHFMRILPSKNVLVVLITERRISQAKGWSLLRLAMGDIEHVLQAD